MAEQVINVISGFYNAVSSDRLYSAEDMNKPYSRIVADGVFATSAGNPSDDLQVKAVSGMTISVQPGQGIFAHKWFENSAIRTFTVDSNTSLYSRIDSIIAQIDNRVSGRVGSIVYRPGIASSHPSAPAINTVTDVVEYRIANIAVAPSTSVITQANITDLRGSSACPWVTAVIQQVDTSVLYDQWEKAYEEYFSQSTDAWEDYEDARQAEWDAFFEELTQDLTLTTNVERLFSTYTTTGTTTNIPVGIASYDEDTDILLVFINGLLVQGSAWYSYASGTNSITLVNALSAGQTVDFVVLKSVITGDISTVETQIQSIETALAAATLDSGWTDLTLQNGTEAFSSDYTPEIRCIGKQVYIRGVIKSVPAIGTTITTIPVSYRPSKAQTFTSLRFSGQSVLGSVVIQIGTDGLLKIIAGEGLLVSGTSIPLDFSYSC